MGLELTRIMSGIAAATKGVDWRLPVWLSALALLVALSGEIATELLRFDRGAISVGEVWRVVTGHLVHLGWSHLLLNLAGLLLVWLLVGDQLLPWQWCAVLLGSLVAVSAGLWYLDVGLEWYVGLSGVLHGLLIGGLVPGVLAGSAESLLIVTAVAAKIGYEQVVGPLPGSESSAGGAVVVNAHLYGAVGGLLVSLAFGRRVGPKAPI